MLINITLAIHFDIHLCFSFLLFFFLININNYKRHDSTLYFTNISSYLHCAFLSFAHHFCFWNMHTRAIYNIAWTCVIYNMYVRRSFFFFFQPPVTQSIRRHILQARIILHYTGLLANIGSKKKPFCFIFAKIFILLFV